MEVHGPGFSIYDRQYLQVVRQQAPESVKPNVFREVDESVAMALLLSDAVALSPEAQELLKKIRKEMDGKETRDFQKMIGRNGRFKDLLYSLKDLHDLVYGKEEEDEEKDAAAEKKKKKEPLKPHPGQYIIPLGGGELDEETRRRRRAVVSGGYLEKMIVYAPNEEVRKRLIEELSPLGEKIISTVWQFGIHIIILDRSLSLPELKIKNMTIVAPGEKTFDGRPWSQVRGIYEQSRRLIVIGEENIGNPARSTARHEFAHAFDHTFTKKNNRTLPLSVQLWNLFRRDREDLVSDYAGVNPAEYFAECLESFFRPDGRETLRNKDPKMYQYLEALFES